MLRARYLLRFDDICPGMNWRIWDRIERVLVERDVRPLLAVVPDNRDDMLDYGPANHEFWDRVRGWQSRGWSIGMHGYQHRYVTRECGLLGLQPLSEFAGLPERAQEEKIRAGLDIFRREDVRADAWVAPCHSFDSTSVAILKRAGFTVISDGFSLFPARDSNGILWVPQQLWQLRLCPMGVWTVAYHINQWSDERAREFAKEVERFGSAICSLEETVAQYGARDRDWTDQACSHVLRQAIKWRIGARRLTHS
jgi:peptidoglycan/xylan/chitin deacetylase (PgdA/CDA1 family)